MQKTYKISVLSHGQKLKISILLTLWTLINVYFVLWWFQEKHIVELPLFVLNTILSFWTFFLPAYFFMFAVRMKKTNPRLKIDKTLRVAMIVTKVPSEPFEMVTKTLRGMLDQKFPHDTWIADEDPSLQMKKWAKKHNVQISSRKDVQGYNNDKWPRRKRCKEGNLAYFYDKYGYDNYDIVVQLDADHVPQANYLENMLRPFANPRVGYVSAPSICSNNAANSWTARARLYAEGLLHGAQQAGHSNGFAPLCFGSHYAVRAKALKEIGGLGPELAEDHSTTMIMNAHGWRGEHAIDAIALGDGPETFADAMKQEFQWSRSLTNLLLMWTPKYLKMLPLKLKIQFLFSQLWYFFHSVVMMFGFMVPLLAIILNTPLVSVSYMSYFLINSLNIIVTSSIVLYLKKLGLLRPIDAKILNWEMAVFVLAKWPWTLYGVISSVLDFITSKEFEFKVTPKDIKGYRRLSFRVILPYVAILAIYIIVALYKESASNVLGYYYFLITGLLMYTITLGMIIFMHQYEQNQ